MFFYSQLPSSLPPYPFLYYPPPLTSDARGVTSVTISTIRNSCIVNNANIAVQNLNITPLDAINNWWGMPTGATHDNIPSGDAVGQNIIHAPHLPTMPFLCDLADADWIPFSEQELQHAINSHIPYLGGIAFALIDFEWGRGAKFDILTHPNYGNLHGVAYISIKPNPTGDLITLQLDLTRLPTDETIQKIVTCELMPLFVNSLQQVQNRYVSPSQNIASMVVMERDLMMRFSPPTEITPDPTPEFVLNYDSSCLPSVTPPSETTPEPGDGESLNLITIPPMEGEFTSSNLELMQTNPVMTTFDNMMMLGDVFTYSVPNQPLVSVNKTQDGMIQVTHPFEQSGLYARNNPSWGIVGENHYRLAFTCGATPSSTGSICYWDTSISERDNYYRVPYSGYGGISSVGDKVAHSFGASYSKVNLYTITSAGNGIASELVRNNGSYQSYIYGFNVSFSNDGKIYYFDSNNSNRLTRYTSAYSVLPVLTDSISTTYYDVYNNMVLYWQLDGGDYDLRLYNGSQSTTLFERPTPAEIEWSPRGTQFVLVEDGCINLYSVTDTTPTEIACGDFSGGIAWTGPTPSRNIGIDLSFMLPPPSDVEVSLTYVRTENRAFQQKEGVNQNNTIPYADIVYFIMTIKNNTDSTITNGQLTLPMHRFKYPPAYGDNVDENPWVYFDGASLKQKPNDETLRQYPQTATLTLAPGAEVSFDIRVQLRQSGISSVNYNFVGLDENNQPVEINATLQIPVNVAVTRLDFNDIHKELRSAMFWAIFNETSEDKYTSGSLYDVWVNYNTTTNQFETIYNPLAYPNGISDLRSENLLVPNADFRQYQVVNFLRQPPYCDPNVSPVLGNNGQPNEQSWFNNILFVTHCNYTDAELGSMQNIFNGDHRYFMAQVALSGMLYNERNPTNGAEGFGVFQYFTHNYGDSLGNKCFNPRNCSGGDDRINNLWEVTGVCASLPYTNYPTALANGREAAVLWLDAYLECMLNRTDNPARRFIFQQAYDNIMREINRVLINIPFDPMGGMYSSKDANLNSDTNPDNSIETYVGGENGTCEVTQTQIIDVYDIHIANLREYTGSDLPTILRPVLKIDREFKTDINTDTTYFVCHQHVWVTKSFQGVTGDVEDDPYYFHYPR